MLQGMETNAELFRLILQADEKPVKFLVSFHAAGFIVSPRSIDKFGLTVKMTTFCTVTHIPRTLLS